MSAWLSPEPFGWEDIVDGALREDIGTGDVSASAMPEGRLVDWYIEAQGAGVVCGLGIVESLFEPSSEDERLESFAKDGSVVASGDVIAQGKMDARNTLQFERTALNFLMHLSGIATATSQYVALTKGTRAKIADTRKTLPGLRLLQKYAVRCGGGSNHRMGLYDAVMIKDNHIRANGSIGAAMAAVRNSVGHLVKIEVECESESQVIEAIDAKADVIMLDNMAPIEMARIVSAYAGKAIFEASGGINLTTVRSVAESGVDIISVGAITHSVVALPFHLELR
ncbi:MAG: carboxylating nicotinate-nucleotide diphosphorylase [Armatimonadota bacterium]